LPGNPATARRVLAPASSPSAGGVPSSRWGASRWVASALILWTASLTKNRPTGERPTARRVARGAGVRRRHGYDVRPVARRAWAQALGCARPWASACPNLQEEIHHGSMAGFQEFQSCARRDVEGRCIGRFHGEVVAAARWGAAGLDTRAQPRFGRKNHGSVGIPEPRARRVATSRHGGASRGFPSARRTGVRRDANTRSARPRGLG
jgi:hypothetical protein